VDAECMDISQKYEGSKNCAAERGSLAGKYTRNGPDFDAPKAQARDGPRRYRDLSLLVPRSRVGLGSNPTKSSSTSDIFAIVRVLVLATTPTTNPPI
jgi:hypothetical protein